MNCSHIKWLDFHDDQQVDWAIDYLYRQGFSRANKAFLKAFMSSDPNVYSAYRLTPLELHKIRANMENAWRVNCSRQKNLRKNPRSVSISTETQKRLKMLSDKRQMPVSELLNDLIADISEFKAAIERGAKNEIQKLKEEHREKLEIARDRSQKITKMRLITKHLKLQKEYIHYLRACIKEFSSDIDGSESQVKAGDGKVKGNGDNSWGTSGAAGIQEVVNKIEESIIKIQSALDTKDDVGYPTSPRIRSSCW